MNYTKAFETLKSLYQEDCRILRKMEVAEAVNSVIDLERIEEDFDSACETIDNQFLEYQNGNGYKDVYEFCWAVQMSVENIEGKPSLADLDWDGIFCSADELGN